MLSSLLSKFYVDLADRRLGYEFESSGGENQGRAGGRGGGDERGRVIDDRHLNLAVRAGVRCGRAEAAHLVLPTAAGAVVPDGVAGGGEQVVGRELALVAAEARRGYARRKRAGLKSERNSVEQSVGMRSTYAGRADRRRRRCQRQRQRVGRGGGGGGRRRRGGGRRICAALPMKYGAVELKKGGEFWKRLN